MSAALNSVSFTPRNILMLTELRLHDENAIRSQYAKLTLEIREALRVCGSKGPEPLIHLKKGCEESSTNEPRTWNLDSVFIGFSETFVSVKAIQIRKTFL